VLKQRIIIFCFPDLDTLTHSTHLLDTWMKLLVEENNSCSTRAFNAVIVESGRCMQTKSQARMGHNITEFSCM